MVRTDMVQVEMVWFEGVAHERFLSRDATERSPFCMVLQNSFKNGFEVGTTGLFLRNGFLISVLWTGFYLKIDFLRSTFWTGLFPQIGFLKSALWIRFSLKDRFSKSAPWIGLFLKIAF